VLIMPHELNAHEYKLLLNPDMFSNRALPSAAQEFWTTFLAPLIDRTLGKRDGNTSRAEGAFEEKNHRWVNYWDTEDCLLTSADLTLRLRKPFSAGGSSKDQLTLKLRKENKESVAESDMPGSGPGAETVFEKDIGPQAVKDRQPGGLPGQSLRKRFALSATVKTDWDDHDHTPKGMKALFPTIQDIIRPADPDLMKAKLAPGPAIEEFVFKGTEVDLNSGIEGEFALTIWNFNDGGPKPRVAEISFRCERPDDGMPQDAADQARELFIAMQTGLGDWVNKTHSSKTALALPGSCGNSSG
jgi:hypothetical protein